MYKRDQIIENVQRVIDIIVATAAVVVSNHEQTTTIVDMG